MLFTLLWTRSYPTALAENLNFLFDFFFKVLGRKKLDTLRNNKSIIINFPFIKSL